MRLATRDLHVWHWKGKVPKFMPTIIYTQGW